MNEDLNPQRRDGGLGNDEKKITETPIKPLEVNPTEQPAVKPVK